MKTFLTSAAFLLSATSVVAEGDMEAGKDKFDRFCTTCHVVKDADGNVLAGRNARTGPNLYGIMGRPAGSAEGFRYSDSLMDYGKTGAVWEEENTVAYLMDPSGFIRKALDDKKARVRMSFRVRKEQDARDIYAFLSQFGAQ